LSSDFTVEHFKKDRESMAETATTPLTGKALLQKFKELSHLPRREKAKRCGYYTVGKNKQTRVNLADFLEALLEAKGTSLNAEGSKDGRGREPTYRVTVHRNGQIVIGSTYTEKMGLEPGDEFEIKLGYKHIHLIQLDNSEDGDEESDEESDE
jgi:AbrB family looped-hinge helix DNA binding protein